MKMIPTCLFGRLPAFVFCLVSAAFAAAPGAPDLTLGTAGFRALSLSLTGTLTPTDIAIDPNGQTVIAMNAAGAAHILRLLKSGAADTSFSGDGFVTIANATASGIAILNDGKSLVVGRSTATSTGYLQRFLPNGALDATFATSGVLDLAAFIPNDVAVLPDGRMVIAGGESNNAFLMRLTATGGLDLSFNGGIVSRDISGTDEWLGVKIQPDGKVIAVGGANSQQTAAIARYNTNGTLDTTFSVDGIYTQNRVAIAVTENYLDCHILDDGRILVMGQSNDRVLVQRFTAAGAPDTPYNSDSLYEGPVFTNFQTKMVVQAPGRAVIFQNTASAQQIIRLNESGDPDATFGTNGIVSTPIVPGRTLTNFVGAITSGERLITIGGIAGNPTLEARRILLDRSDSPSSDFDGDGIGDVAVFRPSAGMWFVFKSSDSTVIFKQFGLNGDIPLDGDFDGDARTDFAIFRPSNGIWFAESSRDGTNFARTFGISTDQPVVNDYDKDGRSDVAIFRPSTGEWFFLRSSSNFTQFNSFPFGQNGDIPIGKAGL